MSNIRILKLIPPLASLEVDQQVIEGALYLRPGLKLAARPLVDPLQVDHLDQGLEPPPTLAIMPGVTLSIGEYPQEDLRN